MIPENFPQPGFERSVDLFRRAAQVIPGGIYGHMSPALTGPGAFPYYADRASGCRYWDVDGREYIDYMCAYGPIVLGYGHPEVEEAAERQRRNGNCFNHPTPIMIELAEKMTELVDFSSWAVFGKNGSDMTTWSIQVAREHTRRKKILRIKGGYHGTHAWCTPGHGGLIEEDRMHIHEFEWNNLQSFQEMLQKYKHEIAAVITCSFHHPAFGDSVMPAPGFFSEVEKSCRAEGILLILDDVRSGFRLDLGGSHKAFGFTPDLICFCKALGNGYPISAALGTEALRLAASKVFLTGSYWNSAVPMAAALTTLNVLERDRSIAHMRDMGERLKTGLEAAATKHSQQINWTGPAAIPFVSFSNETNFHRQQLFCAEMAKRGVFFHPHHNWFLCAAHQPADIDQTLVAADKSFEIVANQFGAAATT